MCNYREGLHSPAQKDSSFLPFFSSVILTEINSDLLQHFYHL